MNPHTVLACCLAVVLPSVAAVPRRATAWIWQCSENETQWNGLMKFANDTLAVDTVSLGAFSVQPNGSFGDGWNCGKLMKDYIGPFQTSAPSVKHTPLIDSGPGSGIANLRVMWNTTETRSAFIESAVENLLKMNLDGYNLDWEVLGTPKDRDNFVRMVRDFGAALRAAKPGATLTSDVAGSLLYDNCTSAGDYLGVTCGNYTDAGVDHVISMGTYTSDADDFCGTIDRASATTFNPIFAPGVSFIGGDTPDVNVTKFFDCLERAPIKRIFLWALGFNHPAGLSPAWTSALERWASPGMLV